MFRKFYISNRLPNRYFSENCRWVPLIYYSNVESVRSCRFQIHLHSCMRNEQWIHTRYRTMKFLPTQVSWIWCKCLQSSFIHSKIFQSDWIQRGIVKKITAQMLITHMWKNADLKYWGQFNKTFKSVIYKCSYCFRILKQWLHLKITLVKVLLNWPMVAATTLRIV